MYDDDLGTSHTDETLIDFDDLIDDFDGLDDF